MALPTMNSISHRHSHCHRRCSFFAASSSTCCFSSPPHPNLYPPPAVAKKPSDVGERYACYCPSCTDDGRSGPNSVCRSTAPAHRRPSRRTGADATRTKRRTQVWHRAIQRQTTGQTDQTRPTTCHHRISSLIRSQKIRLGLLRSQFTNQPSARKKCI